MDTTTTFGGHAVPSGARVLVMPLAPATGPSSSGADRRDERQGERRTPRNATSPLLIDYPVHGTSLRALAPTGPAAPPDRRSSHPGDPT